MKPRLAIAIVAVLVAVICVWQAWACYHRPKPLDLKAIAEGDDPVAARAARLVVAMIRVDREMPYRQDWQHGPFPIEQMVGEECEQNDRLRELVLLYLERAKAGEVIMPDWIQPPRDHEPAGAGKH